MTDSVVAFPSIGFARGAVVRLKGGGPNMLAVRQLDTTTAVIVCEADAAGNLRLREYDTAKLEQIVAAVPIPLGKEQKPPKV